MSRRHESTPRRRFRVAGEPFHAGPLHPAFRRTRPWPEVAGTAAPAAAR